MNHKGRSHGREMPRRPLGLNTPRSKLATVHGRLVEDPQARVGHATAGGASGIVHGWFPMRVKTGNGKIVCGYATLCLPSQGPSGWPTDKWTAKPIDCLRCLKKLGRDVIVVDSRRVIDVQEGRCVPVPALEAGTA